MSGRQFVLEVIKKYRESECLWKSNHPDYRDKNKRNAALEAIQELFLKVDPSANRDTVQKKLQSLRGSYNKELRKVKTSMRSGVSMDDIHVPKLWYYKHMMFLGEIETPRQTKIPHSDLDDMPFDELEEIESIRSPQSQTSTSSKHSHIAKESELSFKKTKAMADFVLNESSSMLDTTGSCDAFGQYVTAELRELPEKMRIICKKIINDAIFQAAIGQLNCSSCVVTNPD